MPHDMIDEYFKIYNESIREYGENICVFYACGSFYEVYGVNNDHEQIGNAEKISEIIRCEFSNKNKSKRSEQGCSTRENPDFCGFGIAYLGKYLNPLLENNYTVIIVDQLESSQKSKGKLVKRGITAVHSPCLKSPDYETYLDTEYNLIGIFIEMIPANYKLNGILGTHNTLIYSICSINNTTNEIEIEESFVRFKSNEFQTGLDEINRILLRYNIGEMRVNFKCESQTDEWYKLIVKYLDDLSHYNNFNYHIQNLESSKKFKEYNNIIFQNEYFKRVYSNIAFGMLKPIEYLNLSDKELSIINLMYTLDFMAQHDIKYIQNLTLPRIVTGSENLILELNTLTQLAILPTHLHTNSRITSVFDVINFTKTAIGRRHLKNILSKPFKNSDIIQKRYDLTEELETTSLSSPIEKILTNLIDFERLHRKMGLQALHPYEFERLTCNYLKLIELFTMLLGNKKTAHLKSIVPNKDILLKFNNYIDNYRNCFDLDKMRHINLNTNKDEIVNFFKTGTVLELDDIQNNIKEIETNMENLRSEYSNYINQPIKISFTDNDGYFFTCTKIRYQKLISELEKKGISTKHFNLRVTSNMAKFYTNDFIKMSNELINTRELLVKKVKLHYLLKLTEYCNNYDDIFIQITKFIETLDVIQSNLECAKRYKYCKPVISENTKSNSFVNAIEMRHPIIEIITNDTEYIPNDITLDNDNLGILLYGLNSSGKSSLLRALGINIILAQCGLYVPCKSFVFSPFSTLISQVDLADNLFASKSSFISEMCGLKKILSCTGPNTLVLSDELCRGTEINSSTAIVASTILELIKTNTKFFFTTHLHELPNVKLISTESKLNICHLSVITHNDRIIFERHLTKGSGSKLYGLEVCSNIVQNSSFIDMTFKIRNEITKTTTSILSSKRSNYNRKKITNHCEVCGWIPKNDSIPLETHHIQEQKNCDQNGFVNDKHYHKNKTFNLVSLCKDCHFKIDTGELIINGYKQTTDGIILDFFVI